MAPIRGLLDGSDGVGSIVRYALARAKADAPHRGSHQFRHALVAHMLRHGTSLPEIGQVLRHRSPQTTSIYAKVGAAFGCAELGCEAWARLFERTAAAIGFSRLYFPAAAPLCSVPSVPHAAFVHPEIGWLPASTRPDIAMKINHFQNRSIPSWPKHWRVLAQIAWCLAWLAPDAHAQSVAALSCIPAVIGGGSGASATCTVTLGAAAPTGGAAVALTSSLTELAASVPRITVPAGQVSVSFNVATNARYRSYSALPFDVAISATRVATVSTTLHVTAQARPADFNSGVAPGARFQWQGQICGRIGPIGGNAEVLYQCSPATATAFGSCTFRQECNLGCRRVAPSGVTFNDFCATSGPNPVTLSRNYVVSGDRVPASLVTEAPVAAALTQGLPGAISNEGMVGAINGISANASTFPHGGITIPSGASSAGFTVATSYVPSTTFIDVVGDWGDAGSVTTTNGRTGHAWLTIVPPEPAPALPMPTLGDFKITGGNPVTGGQSSIGQIDVSGISSAGGPTLVLTSSHPNIATVPATLTLPASTVLGQQVIITTQPLAVDTPVTISASDGRYTFSAVLMVLAAGQPPLLSGVSVSPSSVSGGGSATGTVTLSRAAPSGGAVVALSTPLPGVAVLPASVTVPAGATGASFPISTATVAETFSVNIFSDLAGTGRQALLTVTPSAAGAALLSALSLSPASLIGGNAATGTVTLSAAAPSGGAAVSLASNSNAISLPAVISVPAGATSASFTVSTSPVAASTSATISAAFAGVTRTAALTLSPVAGLATLSVSASGRAGERVTSSPAGINVAVGNSQSASFASNSSITLSASNGRSAIWSGACSSAGQKTKTCTFVVNGSATVSASVQ